MKLPQAITRFAAILKARNLEFIRDRSSMGWNIALPILLVIGLGMIFSGDERDMFKVTVIQDTPAVTSNTLPFLSMRYVEFIAAGHNDGQTNDNNAKLHRQVARHQIDMLLDLSATPPAYWINTTSPRGYMLERILRGAGGHDFTRRTIEKQEIAYLDWVLPGILGMNMMFSCIFGVGYVIVRYRKNGYLKRLYATPLLALEFITAQLVSRLLLIMLITIAVYAGMNVIIGFEMQGNYFTLLLITTLGAMSLVSLGLLVAARVSSEELAGGLLNVLAWPMMLLSGVWYSLEGSNEWVRGAAQLFPLTHLLDGARAVMLDGASLLDIAPQLLTLSGMTVIFLLAGALIFKWRAD